MADLQGEARTPGVQTAVEDEGAADAPVPGGHAEQVLRTAPGAVAVLGEGGEVDVVAGEGGTLDARGPYPLGEDLAHRGARGPGQVQRVQRGAVRLGDGRRHGQARADAAQPAAAQEFGARLDDLAQHLRRVGGDGDAAGCGGDRPAAQAHQCGAESIGVHLGGEGDGARVVDREAVRGAALGTGGGAGAGVDLDEAERFEFGGDRSGRGPGDAQLGGEDGAGGRAAGVDQFERGAECPTAPVQPRLGVRRLAVHGGESPMIQDGGIPSVGGPRSLAAHPPGRRAGRRLGDQRVVRRGRRPLF